MKFSIVTPSLNQGEFIRDCLESVRDQVDSCLSTFNHQSSAAAPFCIEHIIMDACSTDGTVATLESWSEATVQRNEKKPGRYQFQFVSERDRGQTDAINKGLRRASGDWLMWLNADDYLLPQALERVVRFLSKNPKTDLVYGDCLFVKADKSVQRRKSEGEFNWNMLLYYGCYIPSTATFFHRRIIERSGFLDPDLKVCMDYEFFLRVAHQEFALRHFPEPLACFRWHGDNASTVHATRRKEEKLRLQQLYFGDKSVLSSRFVLWVMHKLFQTLRVFRRLSRAMLHSQKNTVENPSAGDQGPAR